MNAKKSTFHHTNGIVHFLKTNGGIMAVLVIFIVILSVSTPIFPTIDNIMSVLRQVFTNVCLGLGLTLVIILGEIDLTGGAVMAMTGTYTVSFIVNGNMPVVVAIILGLCLGLLVGFLNGAIISALNVPAFIVTLSFMNIARGAGYLATGGLATRIQDPAFTDLGVGRIFDIPIQIYYSIVLIIIFAIMMCIRDRR